MTTKPTGQWKCRACGTVTAGDKLFGDCRTWTCSDMCCGGTCDRVKTMPDATWTTRPFGVDTVSLTIRQGHTASVVWLGDLMQVMLLVKAFEAVGCVPAEEESTYATDDRRSGLVFGEHEGEQS